jgi:CubicO group peptidase (beta-lactamase class C family)
MLLGYIIEKPTGQSFTEILETRILDPLSLSQTSLNTPLNTYFVVLPSNPKNSGWTTQFSGEAP